MQIELRVFCIAAAFALGGCGNAYDKIAVGDWVEVGKAEPPGPVQATPYVVETTQPGDGRVVRAGDFVKARLQLVAAGADSAPRIVWVWVGREPALAPGARRPSSASYGSLGSARFRSVLIGRQLNEKFSLDVSAT